MTKQLCSLFKRNFPYLNVDEDTAEKLFSNPDNKVFARYDRNRNVIAASVIYKNVILMLAVDKIHRGHGIGTALLELSERHIKNSGYTKIVFGVGANDYLAPGVPTCLKPVEQSIDDCLWQELDNIGCDFLSKRGYVHKNDANIFDMDMVIDENTTFDIKVGDTADGVTYRLATPSDKEGVIVCCNQGADYFSGFYQSDELYRNTDECVLVAELDGGIVGNLLISTYGEPGTIGCVAVSPKARGKKMARE